MSASTAPQTSAKAPATKTTAKPANKTAAPQAAAPALDPRGLQAALADPLQATPAQMVQLQRQYGNQAVQRLVQDAAVQREAAVGLEGGELNTGLQAQINSARGGGQPLEPRVGTKLGAALGADFSGVRVHTDAQADTLNRSLSARAFTLGSDVFFRRGAYNPSSSSGQHLLAHELTHVVQQGAAGPQHVQTKLTVGPANDLYEQEADRLADQAMRAPAAPLAARRALTAPVIRRAFVTPNFNTLVTGSARATKPTNIFSKLTTRNDGSRGDLVSQSVQLIGLAYRNIVWGKFDADQAIGPKRTGPQTSAARSLEEAEEAILLAADESDTNQAELSKARAEYDLVKADIKQAEGALETAEKENTTKVVPLLTRVEELLTIVDQQLSKQRGTAQHLTDFRQAVENFQTQLEAVPDALDDFRTKIDELKDKEPDATTRLVEAKRKANVRGSFGSLDQDDSLDNPLDDTEDTDLTVEDEDNELGQESGVPPTTRGRSLSNVEPRDDKVVVRSVIGPIWFRELQKIRFPSDDRVDEWAQSDDMLKSARDGRPDSELRNIQLGGRRAIELFGNTREAFEVLGEKRLKRPEAIAQLRSLWLRLRALFDRPGPRTPAVYRAHQAWDKRQAALAGSPRKYDDWKRANADIAELQKKTGDVLREDTNVVQAEEIQINRLR